MMKSPGFLMLFLFLSFKGFSQFELPKKTIKIAPVTNSSGTIAPTSSKTITYPSIFDKKDKLTESVSLLKKQPEEEKSVMDNKPQFENPAKAYTEKMNDMMKQEGVSREIVNSDMFLGEYTVTTFNISIACRDYGAIDGDNVSIWLNDQIVVPAIYLESGMKKYKLELKEGLNTIKIQALNTGELFPNTGQFVFYDGHEVVVTNQKWALNTGYNAIVKIRKVKGIELQLQQEEK
ncbi:hypothetical protein EZL74_04035 [Flavobacterium silvisoli]|uniref:Uncharacterized protein n=1 Tax=Flavobacterium silvisoli TaxID=2529433 RepID=A0A4Q9Z225_9FLAO|nr:hypothetical protein [Flavobacterium silvisoli]TBX70353.1 hypothetical protein EZL74_04035 [Flavobacterium silvisoli]